MYKQSIPNCYVLYNKYLICKFPALKRPDFPCRTVQYSLKSNLRYTFCYRTIITKIMSILYLVYYRQLNKYTNSLCIYIFL